MESNIMYKLSTAEAGVSSIQLKLVAKFDVTQLESKIEKIDGVSSVYKYDRYKLFISIGELFDVDEVQDKIYTTVGQYKVAMNQEKE